MFKWLTKIIKSNKKERDFVYLQNPYFQLNCWVHYRTSDPAVAEEMLKLVVELKELCLKFDAMNKQRFKENFNTWHPYNVWMDVIVSEYLNKDIEQLKEGISIRRKHPNEYISFARDVSSIWRIIAEKSAFEHAFPNEQLKDQFYVLLDKISIYDNFLGMGNPASGGKPLEMFGVYITDGKNRDPENIFGPLFLKEPETYPTYLVYPKAYKTGQEIEYQGVYIPNSPYKRFSLYTNDYEEFYKSPVNNDDLAKLDEFAIQVRGNIEYGLYDPDSPYNIDPNKTDEEHEGVSSTWLESEFYYVKEIPPNTEGIPNNPLRLEHLRYPLKENEHFPTIAELQAKSGFVYQHPHYKVETYNQVVNRYESFYSNYLLEHGVDEALLKDYTEP